jgi:hypothetical protein
MVFFAIRRARLRLEFADVYPGIAPNVWLSARAVAGTVGRANRRNQRSEGNGERVLSNAHFEFRGGRRRRQDEPAQRSRAIDPTPEPRRARAASGS